MKRKLSRVLCLLLMIITLTASIPTAAFAASSSPLTVMLLDKNHNVIKTLKVGSTYKGTAYERNELKVQGKVSLNKKNGFYYLTFDDSYVGTDYGAMVFSNIASIVININDPNQGNCVILETTSSLNLKNYGDDSFDSLSAIHAPGVDLIIRRLDDQCYGQKITIDQYVHRSTDYYSRPCGIYAQSLIVDNIDISIINHVNSAADPSGQARLLAYGIHAKEGIDIYGSKMYVGFDKNSWEIVNSEGKPNYTPDSHFYGLYSQSGVIQVDDSSLFFGDIISNFTNSSCIYSTALNDEYADAYKDSIFYYGIYNKADENNSVVNGKILLKDSIYRTSDAPVFLGRSGVISAQAIYTGGLLSYGETSAFFNDPAVTIDNTYISSTWGSVTRGIEECSEPSDNPGVVIKNNSYVHLNSIDVDANANNDVTDTDFTKTFGILSRHRGVLIQDSEVNIVSGLPIGDAALDEKSSADAAHGLRIRDSKVTLTSMHSSAFSFENSSGTSKSSIEITKGEVALETVEDSATVSTTSFLMPSLYSSVTEGSYNSSTGLASGVEKSRPLLKTDKYISEVSYQFETKKVFTIKAMSNTKLTGSVTFSEDEARVGVPITAIADTNAASSSMLSYQWQLYNSGTREFIDIPNATEATFTPKKAQEGAIVRVIVTSPYYESGKIGSKTITIKAAKELQGKIRYDTIEVTDFDPAKYIIANFDCTQSVSGLSYQWQASVDRGRNWLDAPNLTSNILKFTPSDVQRELMLRVVVTAENCSGSVTGAAITLKPPAAFKLPFTDVKEKNWFYNDVLYVYKYGLMNGVTKTLFEPNTTTTRGMFVTVLYRLEGSPEVTNDNAFKDVKTGFYYDNPIRWATANGIVGGYGNGKFGPEDEITREQMATILYRYYSYKGEDVSELADISSYKDANKIPSYAVTPFKWAVNRGIIKGMTDTTLEPLEKATRAQIAAILNRISKPSVTTEKVIVPQK